MTTTEHSPERTALRLRFAAVSDLGRVRKDNQDSGYVGPWLLAVCDGVGGAVRGDIASATAIEQLRKLDERPEGDLLAQVAGALHRAHDRIGELVDEDPALHGTSTTATVALFDGQRLGFGHAGDSRAYLYRAGELRQLTKDHTFVQGLIDEGRITEDEARVHPHRNLILNAIDGVHDAEPDLFLLDVLEGDRLLLCSDGASGVLDDPALARLLAAGTPQSASAELVRQSLDAGSTDNVTCLVADVVAAAQLTEELAPVSVGAAADLPRRSGRSSRGTRFRTQRSADAESADPDPAPLPDNIGFAIPSDPLDPEQLRYAPRAPRRSPWYGRVAVVALVVGVLWAAIAAAWSWSQQQYYVGERNGVVVIYRGINADVLGFDLSSPYETTAVQLDQLAPFDAENVRAGIQTPGLPQARRTVANLASRVVVPAPDPTEPTDPTTATAGG